MNVHIMTSRMLTASLKVAFFRSGTCGKFAVIGVVFLNLFFGFAQICHTQPQLTSIAVIPSSPPPYPMTVGQSEIFTATGYGQFGDPFPLSDPQWSGDGEYGTIAPDLQDPTKCTYTATSEGMGWIQCHEGGTSIHGSTDISIQPGGDLERIEVTPEEANLKVGQQQQFSAKGFDVHNNELPIDPIWLTDGGTISTGGLYTATTTGNFTVTASVQGSDDIGTATVHVIETLQGDINNDGNVTPGDALCAFWRSILGQFQEECFSESAEQTADVNCDGDITPGDALCIFWRSILGGWSEECQCAP